jgi:hypothetical protein
MNTVELLQHAFKNTLDILAGTTADLTQEQADWQPPGTAMSIGTLYWHTVTGTDHVVQGWGLGQPAIAQTGDWEEKVVVWQEPAQEGDHAATVRPVRVDLAAMHDYARAVSEAAQGWLGTLAPDDLERVVKTPLGELQLGPMLETFVVWHVSAHTGEISALKGLQGGRGYPF